MSTSRRQRRVHDVAKIMPLLERFAFALTGNADAGRRMAVQTRKTFTYDTLGPRLKTQLFAALQHSWCKSVGRRSEDLSRELVLLHRLENFTLAELTHIFEMSDPEVFRLLSIAEEVKHKSPESRVMVMEGDALMSMHICVNLAELGHRVTGIARTLPDALSKAHIGRPDILLSDSVLRDGTSGIAAAQAVAAQTSPKPTIFFNCGRPPVKVARNCFPSFRLKNPLQVIDLEAVLRQASGLVHYTASANLL